MSIHEYIILYIVYYTSILYILDFSNSPLILVHKYLVNVIMVKLTIFYTFHFSLIYDNVWLAYLNK